MEESILDHAPDVINSLQNELLNQVREQPQEIYAIAHFVVNLPGLRNNANLFSQLLLYPHALIELVKLQLFIAGALPRDQEVNTEYLRLALELRPLLVQHWEEIYFDDDIYAILLSATNQASELALNNEALPIIALRLTPSFRSIYSYRLNEYLAGLEPIRWPVMDDESLSLHCLAEEVLSNGRFQAMPNRGTLLGNLRWLREVYNTADFDRNAFLRSVETEFLENAEALSMGLLNAGLTIFGNAVDTDPGIWEVFTQNHWDWRAGIEALRSDQAAILYRLRAETGRLNRLAGFNALPNASFHHYIFQSPEELELHQYSPILYVNENPNVADAGSEYPGFERPAAGNPARFSPADDAGSDDSTSGIDFEASCMFCTATFLPDGALAADHPTREPPRTFACGHTVGAVCWAAWRGLPRCPFCSAPV